MADLDFKAEIDELKKDIKLIRTYLIPVYGGQSPGELDLKEKIGKGKKDTESLIEKLREEDSVFQKKIEDILSGKVKKTTPSKILGASGSAYDSFSSFEEELKQ